MGAVLKKGYVKPPYSKLLKRIQPEVLDKRFTNEELGIIARQVVNWEEKARGLGLTDSEIDDIRNDYHRNSSMQKSAMMSKWKHKNGFKANLENLCG